MPTVRIALYADRPAGFGGVETHMATLAKELAALGHEVRLIFPRIVEAGVFEEAVKLGARLEAHSPAAVERLAARGAFDLLHAHSHRASELAGKISTRYGVPAAVTLHSPEQRLPPARGPRAVIAVSGEIAARLALEGIPHERIENGVDLGRFSPSGGRKRVRLRAVYLGRVSPSKMPGLLALEEALAHRRDIELRYIADWAPGGAARPTAGVEAELREADLVFATGRGVREAMACGAAALVLGTFWDGLVTPGSVERLAWYNFSGRASRERPSAERIAFAARKLLQDRKELQALKAFGTAYARRFWDAREMARRTAAVYRSLWEKA